jgi:hypothetical protein
MLYGIGDSCKAKRAGLKVNFDVNRHERYFISNLKGGFQFRILLKMGASILPRSMSESCHIIITSHDMLSFSGAELVVGL